MGLLCLHYIELAFLAAASLCGAVSAVSMAWIQGFFSGSCPLYGGLAVRNGSSLALSCPSASSLCYFVTGTSSFLALYCLLFLIFWIYCSCIKKFHRGSIGVCIGLTISAIVTFLVLVAACILRYGTRSLCDSIISLKLADSCSEAQKIPWTPPGAALQFYSNLHNAETSSWVNLVLCCVILLLQILQCCHKSNDYLSLENSDIQRSSGTDGTKHYVDLLLSQTVIDFEEDWP